jgi:hypothetical protein
MANSISQSALILQYYKDHPKQDIPHSRAVDWATQEYSKQTGKILRDPDRAIRKMAQGGLLIKVDKGVYKYDPEYVIKRELEDFTPVQKQAILERDGYKCVICGRGRENGVELQIDHVKPKEYDGKATIENGETLCAQHNFQKKTYSQSEMGKKMFLRLYAIAQSEGDQDMINFCTAILEAYDHFGIDGHVN